MKELFGKNHGKFDTRQAGHVNKERCTLIWQLIFSLERINKTCSTSLSFNQSKKLISLQREAKNRWETSSFISTGTSSHMSRGVGTWWKEKKEKGWRGRSYSPTIVLSIVTTLFCPFFSLHLLTQTLQHLRYFFCPLSPLISFSLFFFKETFFFLDQTTDRKRERERA